MELVAGSYEQVLFGYAVHRDPGAGGDPEVRYRELRDHPGPPERATGKSGIRVRRGKTKRVDLKKWRVNSYIQKCEGDGVQRRGSRVAVASDNAHIVEWSPGGERYVVVILSKIDIYQLDTASISGTITNGKRISSITFLSDSVLAVAGDEDAVKFFDCDSLACLCEFKAHENRVKDMFSFEIPEHHVLVTASNDGFIKMWELKQDKKTPPSLLCGVNTSARLTCLGVWLDRGTDAKESLPPAAEPSPVSEEQPKISKRVSGDVVQEEETLKPKLKKCGLTGHSKKLTKGNRLVSTKKRKVTEMSQKQRKKKI
ncbi:PREDICTED: p21-activated protein kinase-interacting protein 1 [Dipodomys ordii]|uniref:P21-activated protein kinase-interacting protein 1 n=1 Tax=Dipodomys ordii TaxID=10020 RepID=A0A1S3F7Q5_DIPOR|nr:PREDICTED: p21-activated protein kinase-interacting protein 1 [Dipodomys ordii]